MSEKKIVNVASYNRVESLLKTVDSIYDQCDELNIFLNNFDGELPSKFLDNKINIYFSDNRYGDALKFAKLQESEGYYLTIDDDLIYPKNYVDYMIARCKEYSNQRVITLHGKNFASFPIQSYYKSHSEYYHCLFPMRKNVLVQFGGTGVMCFHTSLMKIPINFFKLPNMADIWVGKYCKENNIKIICITHPKDFLKYQEQKETIYDTFSKNDKKQTMIVNFTYLGGGIEILPQEDVVEDIVQEPKNNEKMIPIRTTIEISKKTINYDTVNNTFQQNQRPVIQRSTQSINSKFSRNNTMVIKSFQKKR
jgi:hypothetical protein